MKGEWFVLASGMVAFFVYQRHQSKKEDEGMNERLELLDEFNSELWDYENSNQKSDNGERHTSHKKQGKSLWYKTRSSAYITLSLLLFVFGWGVIGVENETVFSIGIFGIAALMFIDNSIRSLELKTSEIAVKIDVLRRQLVKVHREAIFRDETWTDKDREIIAEQKKTKYFTYRDDDNST